ncbi:MAG: DUF4830 domain-containing protein [Oscillospiraceae bacterium]|jgi:hypothetical protein|nr:DUF4830 domain-containing protein [Oscillospiraceae bacterium]
MLVLSLPIKKLKINGIKTKLIIAFLSIIFCLTIFFTVKFYLNSPNENEFYAKSNSDRINFLSQFGWEIQKDPIRIDTITIPSFFNDTYIKYNDIQKSQGLNLEKYKGKICKRFVYFINNYPNSKEKPVVTLLINSDKIIGGDVSTIEYKGFIHGFKKPN